MNMKVVLAVCLLCLIPTVSQANGSSCLISISEGVTLEKVTCTNSDSAEQEAEKQVVLIASKKPVKTIIVPSPKPKVVEKYTLKVGSNIINEMGLSGLPWTSIDKKVQKVLDDLKVEDQSRLPVGYTWCLLSDGNYSTKCK